MIPVFNEQQTILETLASVVRQNHPLFEIIIINDGSTDETLSLLQEKLQLRPLTDTPHLVLPCQPINRVFISQTQHNTIVIDKKNGGKADALNAGINVSHHPLICCVDADCILEPSALKRLACHFSRQDNMVAAGGVVRIANGSLVQNGAIVQARVPKHFMEQMQIIEYMRAFYAGRFGWEKPNSLLIISGAFGMFDRKVLIEAGGYQKTLGEDMELCVRLHHYLRRKKRPYHIITVSDAVCWTQAPQRYSDLRSQRIRWHKGLIDTLWLHRQMLLKPRYGATGMLALPIHWFTEFLGPLIELGGYGIFLLLLISASVSPFAVVIFLMTYLQGVLQSITAVMLEASHADSYAEQKDTSRLLLACFAEPLYYRPLTALWRCFAFFTYWSTHTWGKVSREAF